MAVEFDGERMVKKEDNTLPEHPVNPLCACTAFSCNKLFLFLYAWLYLIVGIGLLLIGVWIEVESKDYEALNNDLFIPSIMMMSVGFIIIINSIVGLSGVLKENAALLKLFLVVTVIAFLAQVAIGVLAFIYRQEIATVLILDELMFLYALVQQCLQPRRKLFVTEKIDNHREAAKVMIPDMVSSSFMFMVRGYSKNNKFTATMDSLQSGFECCGFDSYMDYEENTAFQCGSQLSQACGVPWTCCRKDLPGQTLEISCGYGVRWNSTMPVSKIYTMGCTDKFLQWLSLNLDIVGAVGLGSSIPQIFGILLTYYFIRKVRENKMWYRVGTS